MGIQDRDYYRKEGPSIFDSLVPQGVVCRWLIGINVAVFVMQVAAQFTAHAQMNPDLPIPSDGWVTDWFILDVDKVMHGQVWRLLSYAFLHSTNPGMYYMHLLFNMLCLWWFGSDMEQMYGRREFLAIYLVSAFVSGLGYELWSICWGDFHARCLGASGAVTTMLILCALHFPRRIVYMYILPMPIWLFAIVSVGIDSVRILGDISGHPSRIAAIGHLSGAAFAVAYYKLQWSITGTLREWVWWRRANRARPRLKLFSPELDDPKEPVAVSANSAPSAVVDEHLEAKLDAVLEKIAKLGKESLTPQEQDVLKMAAEMYKKRRT
jgi:membrane associated rhomboid family serine protease